MYDAKDPGTRSRKFWRTKEQSAVDHVVPPDAAISIRNLGKDFRTSIFGGKKNRVVAVSDLSLEIPKYGIYVLLGSNG